MKKILASFAAAVALTSAPSFAQTKPAVDPQAAAVVKQMLVAMKARQMMEASFQQAEQSMPANIRVMVTGMIEKDPNMSAEDKQKALAKIDKDVIPAAMASFHAVFADPTLMDEMMAEMVPLYANNFSVDELRQLAAFYKSPLGQKMMTRMPKIMADSMAMSSRIIAPRMQKIMADTAKSLTKP